MDARTQGRLPAGTHGREIQGGRNTERQEHKAARTQGCMDIWTQERRITGTKRRRDTYRREEHKYAEDILFPNNCLSLDKCQGITNKINLQHDYIFKLFKNVYKAIKKKRQEIIDQW